MKKTRLLEIIREEISEALNVLVTNKKGETTTMPFNTPDEKKAVTNLKQDSNISNIETTAGQNIKETEQLDEIEQLAEMASMTQLKTQLEKQGKSGELAAVKAAEKSTIDKLKQNPVFSGDGKNARLKGYVSALKKELKAEHDINLQDLLTTVMLDAEKAGDKFKDDIATNTIEKDAAAQVLGTEKGQRGRKASDKPAEEKSTKKEKTEKSKPEAKAKETSSDDEEGPSAQDIAGDETAKELSNIPGDKKEKFNLGLKFIGKYKDDKAKVDAYLKKAKDEYKFPKTMLDDLKRAAGRGVE
jgi:hypothetical protein